MAEPRGEARFVAPTARAPPDQPPAAVIDIETARTRLREMTVDDDGFICALLNQPSFLRFIGDRGVRTPEDAATFIETRYRQSYRDHGYGLYVVEDRATNAPMGMCGFVKRDALPHTDMGFAFLPQFEGRGLAHEAASAVLEYGRRALGLTRVLAIVQPDNPRSIQLLTRLGFVHTGEITMPGETTAVCMYASEH